MSAEKGVPRGLEDLHYEMLKRAEKRTGMEEKPMGPRKRVVVAYGTRPEKIKLQPVTDALREQGVEVWEYFTEQSRDLVTEGSKYPYEVCRTNGAWGIGLHEGISKVLRKFKGTIASIDPACVIVQGDTATAFACAQAAFLARVPVAHVEAGMRTYREEPWPEEAFRRQIAAVATWHFAPDEIAATNLCREVRIEGELFADEGGRWGDDEYEVSNTVTGLGGCYVVGNTVIDTLPEQKFRVLVTLHRRENWGKRIQDAIETLYGWNADGGKQVFCIKHPNWNAWMPKGWLDEIYYVDFIDPMPREDLLQMVQHSDVIVTDSGGLQEEAAHFGKPCLVLRTSTERTALERCGAIQLVDPDDPDALRRALSDQLARRRCYGAGDAGRAIGAILVRDMTTVDDTSKAGAR